MEYMSAILAGVILSIGLWGLFTVITSLNELKGILASMSASTDRMQAIAKRIDRNNSRT